MEETEGVMKMEPHAWPNQNPRRSNVHPARTPVVQTSILKEHHRRTSGVTALALQRPSPTNLRSWQVRATGSVEVTSSCQ